MVRNNKIRWVLGAAVLGANITLHAQMAQDPLLSRTAAVEPNIVFIFDDSASMQSTAIYQFSAPGAGSTQQGYQGSHGPNNDQDCLPGQSGCKWTASPPPSPYGRSPDVNLIYYDPRVTYKRRVDANGNPLAAGSTSGISSFNVYFYKPPTTTLFRVGSVTVNSGGGGFASTGVTVTFPNAPSGGTTAQGTVSMVSTKWVTGVTMTSGGSYSTNPNGSAVTFAAPGGSGTAAAGTTVASATTTTGILGVTNTTFNVTSSTALTCSVVFNSVGSGSGATATTTLPAGSGSRSLSSITITSPGSNYGSSTTAAITCGGSTKNNLSVSRGSVYQITGVSMTSKGTGYTSAPAVTFPTSTIGSDASGTATLATTYAVASITVTNSGAGYTACPTTATLSGGGSGASLTPVCTSTTTGGVNTRWNGTVNPNGLATNYGPVNTGDYFNPYLPDAGGPLAAGADATVVYPTTANTFTASTKYPKFINRTDCVVQTQYCTGLEELQNYANWKQYHSTRLELAKTGIGLAFQPLNPTFRLGWGTLGGISGLGGTSGQCSSSGTAQLAKGVRLYNSTTQADFLTWLYGLSANALCTPSRFALDNVGKYFQRADNAGPWAASGNLTGDGALTRSGSDSSHATCRRSYSMLMTDGYYNDNAFSLGSTTDYDSTGVTVTSSPRTFQYSPTGPYSDNTVSGTKAPNTLADVAMKYWLTDLRTDLGNSVKPVSADPAYWQHMTFYAVGLGLIGTIDATSTSVLASLTGNSPTRTLNWPTPPQAGDDTRTIDDMWHATINSRGRLLNAKTASELNSSIQLMMSDIAGKEGTQAGVAVSAPSLTKDTRKYTPTYTPVTWTGDVTAYSLNQTNGNQTAVAWEVEKPGTPDPVTNAVTYSSTIPSAASRTIVVGNGITSGTGNRAVPFTYNDMGTSLRGMMGSSTVVTQQLIDYLRGDPTNEDTDTTGTSPTGIYRPRQTRLGDIVNSTPVFVKNSVDLNYDRLPSTITGQSTYRTFVTTKNARTEGVLFVGANDGMLHAFRDGTYDTSGNSVTPGGAEVFAYVPYSLLPTLSKLSDKTYTHQYYVDGTNTETDAYVNGAWANIVLGSTGAGAGAPSSAGVSPQSAVFAVDTTSINSNVTGMGTSSVLWEVGSKISSNFTELGYVLTDIQAGVTTSGQWIAVFGNGYESKSCQASLFVVDLGTGAFVRELKTSTGSCTTGSKNGLGGVRLVKNANQQVVGAYAGDLLGNMWKFNLTGSAGSWAVDLGGQPLFKAGSSQPITAQPVVITLPLSGAATPTTGNMVVFGTGKFYEVADITTTTQQTLYGIWDNATGFGASSTTGVPLTDTTKLVQQTIGADQTGANGNTYAAISTNAVDYTGTTPKRGWYMNLPKTGQRNVYPLDLLATRFALADTISPSNVSLDPCVNTSGGTGYQYIFDALTGAGPTEAILDTNGDGNITSADLIVSGVAGSADGRNVSIVISSNAETTKYANVSAQSGATLVQISCRLTGTCATTTTGIKHQVRQLFLR